MWYVFENNSTIIVFTALTVLAKQSQISFQRLMEFISLAIDSSCTLTLQVWLDDLFSTESLHRHCSNFFYPTFTRRSFHPIRHVRLEFCWFFLINGSFSRMNWSISIILMRRFQSDWDVASSIDLWVASNSDHDSSCNFFLWWNRLIKTLR